MPALLIFSMSIVIVVGLIIIALHDNEPGLLIFSLIPLAGIGWFYCSSVQEWEIEEHVLPVQKLVDKNNDILVIVVGGQPINVISKFNIVVQEGDQVRYTVRKGQNYKGLYWTPEYKYELIQKEREEIKE